MLKFLKQQKQQKENLASPSKRFLAYSVDIFIVNFCRYLILLLFSAIWFGKTIDLAKHEYFALANQGLYDVNSSADFWKYFFSHNIFIESIFILSIMAISGALYWIIMPTTKYQGTLGKFLLKLKIVTEDNKKLTLTQSAYRYLIALIPWGFHAIVILSIFTKNVGLLLFSMIIVTIWYDPSIFRSSKKAIHDLICKTKVCNRK